jgi:hypothetical protein
MMLTRFRSIGWVAAVAVAVLGCYLISLRVATERASLESLERDIAIGRKHIRVLQTELGARGQMTQLERWNQQALALSAPEAAQFLPDSAALVALTDRQPAVPMQAETQLASNDLTEDDVMPAALTGKQTVKDEAGIQTAALRADASKLLNDKLMGTKPVASVKPLAVIKPTKIAATQDNTKARP